MKITMELIDEMRKRTNCSYQEAKELLEKHDGDILEAIIDFENSGSRHFGHRHNQNQQHQHQQNFVSTVKRLFKKSRVTRFIIEKNQETFLNVPVLVLGVGLLLTMPLFWVYLILLVALYLMGYRIKVRKDSGQSLEINEFMDDLSSKVKKAAEKMQEDGEKGFKNNKGGYTEDQRSTSEDPEENEVIIE